MLCLPAGWPVWVIGRWLGLGLPVLCLMGGVRNIAFSRCEPHDPGIGLYMRPEELQALLDRRPFVPVRIHLSDGTFFDVRHPEIAELTPTHVEISLDDLSNSPLITRLIRCSLSYVVGIERVSGPNRSSR